jgi:AcrR family transcriptional regulator
VTSAARPHLGPDDWIAAATEVLVDQGIDHVRVDVLAGQLGVTRGSFYWHFRDRADLLGRVLQTWREHATIALTQRLAQQPEPMAQLRDVLSLPFRGGAAARAARIELAIRAWARRDALAREALEAADASRLAYIAQIFGALGFDEPAAQARAFVAYAYVVAESQITLPRTPRQREQRRELLEQLAAVTAAR